jgi:hypothetical protein
MQSPIRNTRNYPNRLNLSFALVIEEAADLRNSVISRLRERGSLVHGTDRAEEAFNIFAHIPYERQL